MAPSLLVILIITFWTNSLQSQELAACVSLPCPLVEWLVIILSFGSLNLDKSQLLNRPVFHAGEFPKKCYNDNAYIRNTFSLWYSGAEALVHSC